MSKRNKTGLQKKHVRPPSMNPGPKSNAQRPQQAPSAWVRCKLTAELLEDAHPGSGAGGAGVDALVARDRYGRPVIWASHIEGLLRDAASRLRGQQVADTLFGRAGGSRQRLLLASLYTTQDPTCRVWRSTARASFENRAPMDDTLRAVEFVPRRTQFEGFVELPVDNIPLLRRLAVEVDAIGHGRATGAGRVKLTLKEAQGEPRTVGSATSRLLLLLRNVDPVCITATATPTNLIPSLPFLPGRTLLGAVADWLFAEGSQEAATMLTSGRVSVSDALPLPDEPMDLSSVEVSPAPLSLQSEKPAGTPGRTPWWALKAAPPKRLDSLLTERDGAEGERASKLKRPEPDLFVCRFGTRLPWTAYRPVLRVRLRNGRPRPDQPDPSLFAIEQIAERTFFLAELQGNVSEMAVLRNALRSVLEGSRWLRVGRGGAPVEVARVEWAKPNRPVDVDRRAYLTLTSDILVRDEHLRWLTVLDNSSFAQIYGWPEDVKATGVTQDYAPVHGFNGTSRLWRQPAAAIRRGSIFELEGTGLSLLAKRAAEGRWLGERTHEGFGRFRLDSTLPGVIDDRATAPTTGIRAAQVADDPDDATAAATLVWFEGHRRLAEPAASSAQRPSLSQWLDLVSDLERGVPDALSSRKNPGTAGKRCWKDPDAIAVLEKIERLSNSERSAHARLFVRWLRAHSRAHNRGRAA